MPRLVALPITLFCALSAAILGFNSTPKPLVKPISVSYVTTTSSTTHTAPHVIIHDRVHEHRVVDRAKQLREVAAEFRLVVAYVVAQQPKVPSPVVHSAPTYASTPSLWVCTMNHESDLRTGSHWTFRNGPFEGAFAMAHSTWLAAASDLGLATRYPHAYDAPPSIQLEVAQHARARFGSGKWGGLRACGG